MRIPRMSGCGAGEIHPANPRNFTPVPQLAADCFGAFAASFRGFVLGYYLTTNGPLDTAGSVYFTIALYTLASYVLTQIVVRTLNLGAELAVRLLGALAIGLYYWFASAVVTDHLGLHDGATVTIRTLAFALIALWLWRASGSPADD